MNNRQKKAEIRHTLSMGMESDHHKVYRLKLELKRIMHKRWYDKYEALKS